MQAADLFRELIDALGIPPQALAQWLRAWARVTPIVVIVPAFGLRAVPAPTRIALGLSLAVAIAPSLPGSAPPGPWAAVLFAELVRGVPVAVVAASALWIASMAGGLVDNLRAGQEQVMLPNVEPHSTPLGALLSMLVAIAFLQGGGAAQAAAAVARADPVDASALASLAAMLAGGVGIALSVAAPVLAVSIIVEVAAALIARAASPAFLQPTLAPLRSLAILAAATLLLDRMAEFLALRALS